MYPESLLPKVSYVTSMPMPCLLSEHDLYVIRRVDLPLDEFYDEEYDTVYPIAFSHKELPGWSLNLLCGKCDTESTNWRISGKAIASWDGAPVDVEDFHNEYEFNTNHNNCYFKIQNLHGVCFPVMHQSDRGTRNELKKKGVTEFIEKTENDKVILESTGIFELEHKPNFLNYWHFELRVTAENLTVKRGTGNKAVNTALVLFVEQVLTGLCQVVGLPNELVDPESCYLKPIDS